MIAATGDGSHEQRQVPAVLVHIGDTLVNRICSLVDFEQPFSTERFRAFAKDISGLPHARNS